MLASAFFAVGATAAYAVCRARSPYGLSGGSVAGLTFGILGTAFMSIDALLSLRKRVRTWRIGSAQLWLKMHIWLGLLAVVCIWFHSDFGLGGPLTTVMMVFFYVVIASGIFGLLLQQVLPSLMSRKVPLETAGSQMDHVLDGLAASAYEIVASLTGALPEAREEQLFLEREAETSKRFPGDWKGRARKRPAESPEDAAQPLREFYVGEIRPFLRDRKGRGRVPDFRAVVLASPEDWQPSFEMLSGICEEVRQLAVQRRLHGLLHGWLFLHAPLSLALFVLIGFHIVFALRY